MTYYVTNFTNERTADHSAVYEDYETACIAAAEWCKAVHPPPAMAGRFWGPPRRANVMSCEGELDDYPRKYTDVLALYYRAPRGNTSICNEFIRHIGKNVIRVLFDEEYRAYCRAQALGKRAPVPKVGTMQEEIARGNV